MWARRRQAQQERRQREQWAEWDARALATLGAASTLSLDGVGFANIRPPSAEAFEYLRAAGPRVGPGLSALLATATPAGKALAASLLERLDPTYGRQVWEWLAEQPGAVDTSSGCVILPPTPLATYAREHLARSAAPTGFPPPQR